MNEAGGRNIRCLTSGSDDVTVDETSWAKLAASVYGLNITTVRSNPDNWLTELAQAIWHMDAPGNSPAIVPHWSLMREARASGTIVVMEGQGGDEAFGGYAQYNVLALLDFLGAHRLKAAPHIADLFREMIQAFGARQVIGWTVREVAPWTLRRYRQSYGALSALNAEFVLDGMDVENETGIETRPTSGSRLGNRMRVDHGRDVLPQLLHYGDAVSSAHGVETRLPFLDFRLVEWAFRSSNNGKIFNGKAKWILRQFLKECGQILISQRTDKKGYSNTIARWLVEGPSKDLLLNSGSAVRAFCDQRKVERLIKIAAAGNTNVAQHIFRLVTTEIWLKKCIAGDRVETGVFGLW
jgi:asparagine synthase (glutamine-hydrolysing)